MDLNITRSLIFITAGLVMILFPKFIVKFQNDVLRRFKVKARIKEDDKANLILGIIFVAIGVYLIL